MLVPTVFSHSEKCRGTTHVVQSGVIRICFIACRAKRFSATSLFTEMASKRSSRDSDSAGKEIYQPAGLSFPFTAIVGQREMKLALIANAIDPLIGGVLIMGHRGTGKSTAVRALADLLPPIKVVTDCSYNCDPENAQCAECKSKTARKVRLESQAIRTPVAELPLGATEDRVTGTISIERAVKEGVTTFEPGLLARVNRGFFYIDEVNLLEDHLVDLLLDVAATGWNRVEREGLSVVHPSRFVLVGSGNPEEGDLRPQLLDRFGLSVEITTEQDTASRVEIIRRRDRFDGDPNRFRDSFSNQQDDLQNKISSARKNLRQVTIAETLLTKIAQLCMDLHVDGHRGELTIMRAARALAAFDGRSEITNEDVRSVTTMALRHRTRKNGLDDSSSDDLIQREIEKSLATGKLSNSDQTNQKSSQDEASDDLHGAPSNSRSGASPDPAPPPAKNSSRLDVIFGERTHRKNEGPSKLSRKSSAAKRTVMNSVRGRHSRSTAAKPVLHPQVTVAATLLAALKRGRRVDTIKPEDLRYKLYSRKRGTLFIFAIDSSGSMGRNRIAVAKRVILDRLEKSYVDRDTVAIINFRGNSATLALTPTRSILRARRVLDSLAVGGATPLSAGLLKSLDLIQSVGQTHGEVVLLLFTDGRANVSLSQSNSENRPQAILSELSRLAPALKKTRAMVVVVDTKLDFESSADTKQLASILDGQWIRVRQSI